MLFASLEGALIPYFAAPHLGFRAHTLGGLESVLLIALGLAWTRLSLSEVASRVAFWLLVYSTVAILAAYVLGAFWGAGNETIPMAAGAAHGSPAQEGVVKVLTYSSAPTGFVSFVLILWGSSHAEGAGANFLLSIADRDRWGHWRMRGARMLR